MFSGIQGYRHERAQRTQRVIEIFYVLGVPWWLAIVGLIHGLDSLCSCVWGRADRGGG